MKKLLSLIITLIVVVNIRAFASDIFIQPTMQMKTSEQNRVWTGAFQLAWNDFMDKVVHGVVRFREGTPPTIKMLNQQTFNCNFMKESSIYKYSDKISSKTAKKISKALAKKYGDSGDILDTVNLEPSKNKYLILAMLKREIEFAQEFENLGTFAFSKDMNAEYFGINKDANKNIRDSIKVLFYNNEQDYAVSINTNNGEEVILYKNSANKGFNYLMSDLLNKSKVYEGIKDFTELDELRVPNISFAVTKSFDEVIDKRIMATNMYIQGAVESIKFVMNNKGAEVKEEIQEEVTKNKKADLAEINKEEISENQEQTDAEEKEIIKEPRNFYFNDTFVVLIRENSKPPYFALRVKDIKNFQ